MTIPAMLLSIIATGVTDWRILVDPTAPAWKSLLGPVCLGLFLGALIV